MINLINIDKYINSLITQELVPGISLLVAKGEEILIDKVYGFRSIFPEKEELKNRTIYDLASLTKPLITSLLTLRTIEKGKLSFSTEVSDIFPEFSHRITIKDLLTHTSGLPAWYPFYLFEEDLMVQLNNLALNSKSGKKVNYSCVGYIIISKILEQIYELSFAEIVEDLIIRKLGLKDSFIGEVPEDKKNMCAPTELGNKFEKEMAEQDIRFKELSKKFTWRENLLVGELNDANSFYLNGNSGNAGLFSSAIDIFKLSNEFYPSTATILSAESTKWFWNNLTHFKKSHRTIGFKLNSSFITSGGRGISRKAIGHNGFTGVSIWFEPKAEYKFIILSNRIHPEVKPLPFNKIRRKIHKLIKKEISKK